MYLVYYNCNYIIHTHTWVLVNPTNSKRQRKKIKSNANNSRDKNKDEYNKVKNYKDKQDKNK